MRQKSLREAWLCGKAQQGVQAHASAITHLQAQHAVDAGNAQADECLLLRVILVDETDERLQAATRQHKLQRQARAVAHAVDEMSSLEAHVGRVLLGCERHDNGNGADKAQRLLC